MSINLTKGGNISLEKEAPGLTNIRVGLGWDLRATDGEDFDLDASCFMLKDDDKVRTNDDLIFYNNKQSACGSVVYLGDNRTGEGEGDDEVITVDLTKIPADIQKLSFTVSIYEYDKRKQNFGQVSHAYIRIVNDSDQKEIARFDLSEDASTNTAIIFGELYRHNGQWKFKAVGQGFDQGLNALMANFGIA